MSDYGQCLTKLRSTTVNTFLPVIIKGMCLIIKEKRICAKKDILTFKYFNSVRPIDEKMGYARKSE
jgi:hypothetical protein